MKRVINFMGIRHIAFALTVLLTLASLASLAIKGLNFGLDFTGGTLIELGYEQPAQLDKVRSQMAQAGYPDAIVQSFGASTDVLLRLQGDALVPLKAPPVPMPSAMLPLRGGPLLTLGMAGVVPVQAEVLQ
jgi:preprotein translocase subunit SecF